MRWSFSDYEKTKPRVDSENVSICLDEKSEYDLWLLLRLPKNKTGCGDSVGHYSTNKC